eukprot:g43089.t1
MWCKVWRQDCTQAPRALAQWSNRYQVLHVRFHVRGQYSAQEAHENAHGGNACHVLRVRGIRPLAVKSEATNALETAI